MHVATFEDGRPEIFHTLQGEGVSAGAPAVFIRLSRCNLHCIWCDSEHTWNFAGTPWPHRKDDQPGSAKPPQAAVTCQLSPLAAAEQILAYECPRVVITGGEPLLQQDELLAMIHHLRRLQPNSFIELETNATLIPGPELAAAIDQFNVSPKLANSAVAEPLRLRPAPLHFFATHPAAWFKFVVAQPADLAEIDALCRQFNLPPQRLLLMPEGRNTTELDRNAPWLAQACRDRGLRYADRLHIRLWGERRGV